MNEEEWYGIFVFRSTVDEMDVQSLRLRSETPSTDANQVYSSSPFDSRPQLRSEHGQLIDDGLSRPPVVAICPIFGNPLYLQKRVRLMCRWWAYMIERTAVFEFL